MKKVADGLPPLEGIGTKDWGRALAPTAFVYRITGDRALLEKIKKMLRASLDFYDRVLAQDTITNVNAGAVRKAHLDYPFTRISWLAAFDWVWNDLTPQQRQELASSMIRHVHNFMTRFAPHHHSWYGSFYYWDNMLWYAGVTLLQEDLGDEDYMLALSVLEKGYGDHRKMLELRDRARGDDGDFQYPQMEYALSATAHAEWSFFHSWRAAIDTEIPKQWFSNGALYSNIVFWNILPSDLPGIAHFGYAFSWHLSNRVPPAPVAGYLAQHIYFYEQSHPELTALSRYLWKQLDYKRGGKYGHIPIWSGLWSPVDVVPVKLPANMPLARHFQGSGMVFMRSGHGPDDTYALFSAGGGPHGSSHRDATHFSIYKKGFLALDTGTRKNPHHSEYTKQTVAHNCVLINNAGMKHEPNSAKPLAFETGPYFSYAASDATNAYTPDKGSHMVRQFIFLPPNHFIVFDRVTSKKAEDPTKWLLHTSNEPILTGKEFHADQGDGRIFCRTLYPADAVLEKIGGPGKEFWVDGRNWSLPNNWGFWHYGYEEGNRGVKGKIPETMGRWRVEVKPGQLREEDYFLHLIQASNQTVKKMVDSNVSETADRIQLTFSVGMRAYTITLNKTGKVGGHIRILSGGNVLVDRPLTREVMPQIGLALAR